MDCRWRFLTSVVDGNVSCHAQRRFTRGSKEPRDRVVTGTSVTVFFIIFFQVETLLSEICNNFQSHGRSSHLRLWCKKPCYKKDNIVFTIWVWIIIENTISLYHIHTLFLYLVPSGRFCTIKYSNSKICFNQNST